MRRGHGPSGESRLPTECRWMAVPGRSSEVVLLTDSGRVRGYGVPYGTRT